MAHKSCMLQCHEWRLQLRISKSTVEVERAPNYAKSLNICTPWLYEGYNDVSNPCGLACIFDKSFPKFLAFDMQKLTLYFTFYKCISIDTHKLEFDMCCDLWQNNNLVSVDMLEIEMTRTISSLDVKVTFQDKMWMSIFIFVSRKCHVTLWIWSWPWYEICLFFLAQIVNSIARKGPKIQPPRENQRSPRGNKEIMPTFQVTTKLLHVIIRPLTPQIKSNSLRTSW